METEAIQEQMPVGMPMQTVIERTINAAGPGPYFVYMPGIPGTGLWGMTHSFGTIPAGQSWRIGPVDIYLQASQMPEGMARKERITKNWAGHVTDHQQAFTVPGGITLDALTQDMSLARHRITKIPMFDLIDPHENIFNKLIMPTYIEENTFPKAFRQALETEGMLRIRRRWLEQAEEALDTGRLLEDYLREIERVPYLRDIWLQAIEKVLIPAVDGFEQIANSILAQKEEAIRGGTKAVYDTYDNTLMWLLGRKPERTALSRTLEQAGRGGGLDKADLKQILTEVLTAAGNNASAATIAAAITRETVACPDCAEDVKLLPGFGGPPRLPRICRFCRYEFTALDVPAQEEVVEVLSTEVLSTPEIGVSPTSDDFQAALLANGIKKTQE